MDQPLRVCRSQLIIARCLAAYYYFALRLGKQFHRTISSVLSRASTTICCSAGCGIAISQTAAYLLRSGAARLHCLHVNTSLSLQT